MEGVGYIEAFLNNILEFGSEKKIGAVWMTRKNTFNTVM
jgi:hypothetical protein